MDTGEDGAGSEQLSSGPDGLAEGQRWGCRQTMGTIGGVSDGIREKLYEPGTVEFKPDDSERDVLGGERAAVFIVIGKEVAPETGTLHLQGYIRWKNPRTWQKIKDISPGAHVETARGNAQANYNYCSKEGHWYTCGLLQASGKRTDLDTMFRLCNEGKSDQEIVEACGAKWALHRERIRSLVESIISEQQKTERALLFAKANLYAWQTKAVEKIESQSDRKILFIVGEMGNEGKSYFADYLVSTKNALKLTTTKRVECAFLYTYEPIVVFDMVRHDQDFINYGTMEMFKGSTFISTKYKCKVKYTNSCKVIVVMNQSPDLTKLSSDRYDVMTLG